MPGLKGTYVHSVDEKGRVTLPARLRELLGDRFVVTRGFDRCLFVYPEEGWEQLERKLDGQPLGQSDARAFKRLFFASAGDAEPDRQGRVLLPQHLRDHARIIREVVIVGVSERVEIWAREEWEEYSQPHVRDYDALGARLVGM
ncbi:MAG: division/cell wall cluster transcriptional repressor MraZ [bacterium]|nr:division/cell wall cluster transcriptional repressor MraZ [bacterium]